LPAFVSAVRRYSVITIHPGTGYISIGGYDERKKAIGKGSVHGGRGNVKVWHV